jgi:hypothetical protein
MFGIFKVRRTEAQWNVEQGRVLFTWSIINPNGPTLGCAGIRYCGVPGQVEVFHRWLHFLGGESFVLGYVDESSKDFAGEVLEILRYAFKQPIGRAMQRFPLVNCVPSFVTVTDLGDQALITPDDVRDLIASSLAFKAADWGREMFLLERFGSRFYERAGHETREAIEREAQNPELTEDGRHFLEMTRAARGHLPGFANWQPNQYSFRAFTVQDKHAWWEIISQQDFVASCLTQFAHAWAGAIHQARGTQLDAPEPFELVRDFLAFHQSQLWPDTWNSSYLLEGMGIE